MIEQQEGMTFGHDFGYSFPLSLLKRGKKKRRMNRKYRDQKSCLSAQSTKIYIFFRNREKNARNEQFLMELG